MSGYLKSFVKFISTFCYIGYLPFAPGTFASLAALVIYFLAKGNILNLAVLFTVLGFLVSGRAERVFDRKDSPRIVIDEVSGMLISLLFLPYNPKVAVCAFVLFRIFDISKPAPLRRLQNLRGSSGVMLDDIAAGLYANIILQVVLRFISFKAS
ncbi:MAG: phosphatidylglycerophosphatase A [Candidatus Omnitrophica bacterium]|nr:phosphatidylglycerophosphatase A [Candidatus Omnitrophota bacterium]